ncbi:MAG: peptide chain release factor N(5)-glutamine methyltransferase [Chitinispirillaceae bacterium]|nr:peptide chain release factor N(5)-glutamine methyltransferase [Chitinispirillaceae bacterium]
MTISQSLTTLREAFSSFAGEYALSEAERVLTYLLDCPRSQLYLSPAAELPDEIAQALDGIIRRRSRDEPLAYILGSAYFFNREFVVDPSVLIPRADTEILVETVLKNESEKEVRFIDLGTGSGCIATILSSQNPSWRGVAIDHSPAAVSIARRNGKDGFSLLCCDRLTALRSAGTFDFLVSNPPYIKSSAIGNLPKSVGTFEPLAALDGGIDGLDFYRYLAENAPLLLKSGGRIYCEIGYDQGETVPAIFTGRGWVAVNVTRDFGGHQRVMFARRPES